MLKLRTGELILVGVTDREMLQLTNREPLLIDGGDLLLPGVRIAIFHAADEAGLVDRVRELGLKIKPLEQKSLAEHKRLQQITEVTAADIRRAIDRLVMWARRLAPIEPSPCWHCGKEGDAATTNKQSPRPGDWALCSECGSANVLDDKLRLSKPTPAHYAELDAKRRAELEEVQAAVRSAILLSRERRAPEA